MKNTVQKAVSVLLAESTPVGSGNFHLSVGSGFCSSSQCPLPAEDSRRILDSVEENLSEMFPDADVPENTATWDQRFWDSLCRPQLWILIALCLIAYFILCWCLGLNASPLDTSSLGTGALSQ